MDVVSVYSSGIKNVISNSGTALTEKTDKFDMEIFSDPIICLDGDQSGQNSCFKNSRKTFTFHQ